jgi:predicted DNA-binding ribbon-helix-helix protein
MRLEPELWEALEEICRRERMTMRDLVRRVEQTEHTSGRTSAVRVYIVDYFRAAATVANRMRPAMHSELAMTGD